MKFLIKIEELAIFLLTIYLFGILDITWWWFPLFLLAPDLSMIGYAINKKVGAYVYNLIHHKGLSIGIYIIGGLLGNDLMQFIGLIILAHSSIDRLFDYGFKFADNFQHTHLSKI